MKFKSKDQLEQLRRILEEGHKALGDTNRTSESIEDEEMSDFFRSFIGAGSGLGVGAGVSFTALYALGTVGLSAAGISSGLAAAGAIVGGGMAAGVGVLAAPIVGLAGAGYGISRAIKNKGIRQVEGSLYPQVVLAHNMLVNAVRTEGVSETVKRDRFLHLQSLIVLLRKGALDLAEDLGIADVTSDLYSAPSYLIES